MRRSIEFWSTMIVYDVHNTMGISLLFWVKTNNKWFRLIFDKQNCHFILIDMFLYGCLPLSELSISISILTWCTFREKIKFVFMQQTKISSESYVDYPILMSKKVMRNPLFENASVNAFQNHSLWTTTNVKRLTFTLLETCAFQDDNINWSHNN